MSFQVKARFTCDGKDCEETAEAWVNLAIDTDTEYDSFGGKTDSHFIETTTAPQGWHQRARYGRQYHYCSLHCERSR